MLTVVLRASPFVLNTTVDTQKAGTHEHEYRPLFCVKRFPETVFLPLGQWEQDEVPCLQHCMCSCYVCGDTGKAPD